MSSTPSTYVVLFNILFFTLTHGQVLGPSPLSDLNCSNCRVNPIGLGACGVVLGGGVAPVAIRLCCSTLKSLSAEDLSACLCKVIKADSLKPRNMSVQTAVDRVLTACSNI
ncbi:hypothetical protein DCAR_0728798 [Daucus carota subsp. sativus]|uniref:Hydrophobic seed protein domain-containing protein n=1 Tax=Daucus carota subsp. sativus TaxID=79200 RepID=A0A164TUN4_DAUCS|nr:PREDICTED: putative lipid-binding protein AIR1 [Daucus carota subsp. sativus]WOH09341.1 hypothetical protein DCAR_0728798 [Daucus carota subsp. sativus]